MPSGALAGASEQALTRAAWQKVIFAEPLRRDQLLSLSADLPLAPLRISVIRNHAFEFIASAMQPFLAYAGYCADFVYSAYDDSLTSAPAGLADIEIVWLDYSRYRTVSDFADWLRDRVLELRSRCQAPMLIANCPDAAGGINEAVEAVAASVPGVYVCDQTTIANRLGPGYVDSRLSEVAGTALSGAACLETARMFGLVWIPAIAGPRIKAIAVDLDHTLYAGVLGEDGVDGLSLTEAHARLQRKLLEYRDSGVFLAAVSRNETSDVIRVFGDRADFPLKFEHFSAHSISWDAKAAGLREVASTLRIGADAILFVDDNAGELAAVASEIPGIRLLHASDPSQCERALSMYPGLAGAVKTASDELRVRDLDATAVRASLRRQSADPEEYLRSLRVELLFQYNPAGQIRRIHELSVKTNQFNTAFLRLPEAEVARRLQDPECATVAVALKDRLTDSGVIAAVFGRWAGRAHLRIEEIVISCRALGRELETIIVAEAIRGMLEQSGRELPVTIEFSFLAGERNRPAREWLQRFTQVDPGTCSPLVPYHWAAEAPGLTAMRRVISIEWTEEKQ